MDKIKNERNFLMRSSSINKHIKRLKNKEKEIFKKLNELCRLLDIDEITIEGKIKELQRNVLQLIAKKNYRMKSKVQTYDIRDCEEYYGILELEALLRKGDSRAIDTI